MAQSQGRSQFSQTWRKLRFGEAVFKDPFAIERLDDREQHDEERFVIIGVAEGKVLLFVAYTERQERIRIISARRATQYEQDDYFQRNA